MERDTNSMFSFPFDQMLDLFNKVLRVGNDTDEASNNNDIVVNNNVKNINNNPNNNNDEETLPTFSVLINEAAFKPPTLTRDERFVELLLEEETKIGDVDSETLNDYEEEEIDYDDRTISSDDDDRSICR
ncbi:hypothetical protein Glove_349g144 [Diversispora epigaea]|uniref:Uncharacterized protein n=1 Tax=Diversispora epigaea TaxID=1348612 RepID=A0A397HIC2_9GLOM|nr:hypothetical protein Glove_349g144 [Diversispora epigaea]